MNLKVALLPFLMLFTSTITGVATAISLPVPGTFSATHTLAYNVDSVVQPTGDPVDDPVMPMGDPVDDPVMPMGDPVDDPVMPMGDPVDDPVMPM